jgi:predicted AAA+ superfamily ATPase
MNRKLIQRQKYLDKALLFRDTDLVKVVTGIRRCGKSFLLQLVRQHIEGEGKPDHAFLSLNLEDRQYGIATDDDLYAYIAERLSETGRTYIFIDEIQRIEGWHDVVNSMRVGFDCDIYVTGSNAFLLSSEIATYLSGRYIEVKMLPLAFSEFLDFCGLSFAPGSTATADGAGQILTFDDIFLRYLNYGGMPAIATLGTNQTIHSHYMEGLYDTVIVRDIMNRERNASERRISNPDPLKAICEYLSDNIGNMTSLKKIADTLTSAGRKTHHDTVRSYVKALEDAYIFYPAKRYDIHGKAILKTLPKYYVVDTGLRRFLAGYRDADTGFVFENAVYLQLLFEGWSVHVGKLYQNEVDFVAAKDGKILYVQVADGLYSEAVQNRELKPLLAIPDAHEKIIVVRQGDYRSDIEGVRIVKARDFFVKD